MQLKIQQHVPHSSPTHIEEEPVGGDVLGGDHEATEQRLDRGEQARNN